MCQSSTNPGVSLIVKRLIPERSINENWRGPGPSAALLEIGPRDNCTSGVAPSPAPERPPVLDRQARPVASRRESAKLRRSKANILQAMASRFSYFFSSSSLWGPPENPWPRYRIRKGFPSATDPLAQNPTNGNASLTHSRRCPAASINQSFVCF